MKRKILADGEHSEGCNYDLFQRAHAQWQCLHFHPEREKHSQGMTGGNMPFIAIKDNNSLQKIVSIAFQPRSKMALMGVTV